MPFFRMASPRLRAWDSSYGGSPLSRFQPSGERSLAKAVFCTGSSLPVAALGRVGWDVVDQLGPVWSCSYARGGHRGVRRYSAAGHEGVDGKFAGEDEVVGDIASVAAPPHRFGTHDGYSAFGSAS